MNRIDRLTAMILVLQSRRVVTAEQIADHFEISMRTVYRDIAALGEAGVPIVAEAGVGYSLMRGYHVPPIMFTEEEAAALFMGGEIAERFGDGSLKQSLRSALLKVRAALPEDRKDYLCRLGDAVAVGNWDRTGGSLDHRFLMPAQEAVVRRRCLALHYDAGGRGELTERVVEALGVIFYSGRWHLIAWCRLREALRDFRLDRVRRWEVLNETFDGHDDFSLMEFLQNEIDESEMTPVSMVCERWAAERVLADIPGRTTGQKQLPDGRLQIDALAFSLDWLAGWLLGLGVAVEVLAPDDLREKVVAAATAVAGQYQKS